MATKWQIENRDRWLAYMTEYRKRPDVLEKRRERERLKRQSDDDWRKQRNQACLAYYIANRERQRAKGKEWYKRNVAAILKRQSSPEYKEHASAIRRKRYANNPEKYRAKQRDYVRARPERKRYWRRNEYARKRGALGYCTDAQLQDRFEFHGNCCVYCKRSTHLTVDHLIPLSRGGSNWPANLGPACRPCNSRKHDKTYQEFMVVLSKERNQ